MIGCWGLLIFSFTVFLHPFFILRKEFLHVATHNVHLKGIGGPGAPHTFCLQRREDIQRPLAIPIRGPVNFSKFSSQLLRGVQNKKPSVCRNPEALLLLISEPSSQKRSMVCPLMILSGAGDEWSLGPTTSF